MTEIKSRIVGSRDEYLLQEQSRAPSVLLELLLFSFFFFLNNFLNCIREELLNNFHISSDWSPLHMSHRAACRQMSG